MTRTYQIAGISRTDIMNTVEDFGDLTPETIESIVSDIVIEVNNSLPETIEWVPDTSEIYVDGDTDFDEDEIRAIIDRAVQSAYESVQ